MWQPSETRSRLDCTFFRLVLIATSLAGSLLLCLTVRRAGADELRIPDTEEISTASIDNFPLPPSAESAYQAIMANNASIAQLDDFIASARIAVKEEEKKYEAAVAVLGDALRDLASLGTKCPIAPKGLLSRQQDLQRTSQALRDLVSWVKGNPSTQFYPSIDADAKALCKGSEPLVLNDAQIAGLLSSLKGMREEWVKMGELRVRNAEKLKGARESLKKRLEEEAARLKQASEKTASLTSDLKWLILILSCLSVSVMLVLRGYSEAIQNEWVASGQVIQFMTVLIILIAILILGLANILKENILGTLLGGIGGYVLAQGVGRSAARSASVAASKQEGHDPK